MSAIPNSDSADAWLVAGVVNHLIPSFTVGLGTMPRLLLALCKIAFLEFDVTDDPDSKLTEFLAPALRARILNPD